MGQDVVFFFVSYERFRRASRLHLQPSSSPFPIPYISRRVECLDSEVRINNLHGYVANCLYIDNDEYFGTLELSEIRNLYLRWAAFTASCPTNLASCAAHGDLQSKFSGFATEFNP